MKVTGWTDREDRQSPSMLQAQRRAPDLERHRNETGETVRALIGIDPQTVLDLYLAAQQKAAGIRERIAEVSSELATYKARYWGGDSAPSEQERKAVLARLRKRVRDEAHPNKLTVDAVDDLARSTPQYRDYLHGEQEGRLRMELLQAELSREHGKLETALGVVEYYAKAHKSCDSLVWFAREENKKTF
jgi:hypothetical protein